MEKRVKPDVVLYYRDTYASFPNALTLPNGEILVVFRESTQHTPAPGGKMLLVRSADQGSTWSEPVVVSATPGWDDYPGRIVRDREGVLWASVCAQLKEADYKTYFTRSYDNGKTWEKPIFVSHCNDDIYVTDIHGVLSNGQILLEAMTCLNPVGPQGKRVQLGRVGGVYRATAYLKNPKAKGEFEWDFFVHPQLGHADEWTIAELEPGHLIAIMRQQPNPVYFQTESLDYGRTWTKAAPTTIAHSPIPSRPRLFKLENGVLVLAYAERSWARVKAIPSFDGGKTWQDDRKVVIFDNPDYCNPRTGDFGYTTMARAGDDKYLFIYYAHPGKADSPQRGIYGNFVPAKAFEK